MPTRADLPCAGCGKLMWRGTGSLPKGATCQPCRRAGQGSSARFAEIDCQACGKRFIHDKGPDGTGGWRPKTCSKACASAMNKRPRQGALCWRNCVVCDSPYRATYGEQETCGRACGWQLRFKRHPPKAKPEPKCYNKRCASCTTTFESTRHNAKYCSKRCKITECGERLNDLYGLASQTGCAGARWRELLVGYLQERDGRKCQICKRKIRFDLPSGPRGHPSGNGPSIDHVIPKSEGGDDDLANLRLTHWRCNQKRGNRGGNEQLMLIG